MAAVTRLVVARTAAARLVAASEGGGGGAACTGRTTRLVTHNSLVVKACSATTSFSWLVVHYKPLQAFYLDYISVISMRR